MIKYIYIHKYVHIYIYIYVCDYICVYSNIVLTGVGDFPHAAKAPNLPL